MVVYYIKKVGESLADYRYPIKEGDICMLYDGDVVKTVYIDSEIDSDSIWRDYKFVDTKSLKSYQFPASDSILCAPIGDRHAIGDTGLLTQLIKECKGEWLLDFLNETSAVLSGFVDYWDLGILRRFTGDDDVEVTYVKEETLSEFLEKPDDQEDDDEYDEEEEVDDTDFLPKSYDIKWFCLSALTCIEDQLDKRSYQILADTLKGDSRSEIADRHHLTQERIRQIVVKTTKQAKELLIGQRKSLDETKAENAKLKVQLNLLREDIAGLKALLPRDVFILKSDEQNIDDELTELLEIPLMDISLPARAINILKYMGIEKFADIPQIDSYMRVMKERNSGRKTVHDVTRLLEDFYLTFGMSYTEIVNVLKENDWHAAKRKWMGGYEDQDSEIEYKNTSNNTEFLNQENNSEGGTFSYTSKKPDKRIGYLVRLFPSQQVGVIVSAKTDGKGFKKLVVRTNEGNTMVIDDLPYLYEVLKREAAPKVEVADKKPERTDEITPEEATITLTREIIEAARTPNGGFTKSQLAAIGIDWPAPEDWIDKMVGTMITPTQLEKFNRIEYVAKPSEASYRSTGTTTYKDVAFNSDDRRKMEAILQAMTHFYAPATPYDIARTISRSAWGDEAIREGTVDSILKRLPEVEYIKWGKYILKSRNKE